MCLEIEQQPQRAEGPRARRAGGAGATAALVLVVFLLMGGAGVRELQNKLPNTPPRTTVKDRNQKRLTQSSRTLVEGLEGWWRGWVKKLG